MSRKFERATAWVLLYLWSVPLVVLIQGKMKWAYDGDWEFWLAAAYSLPAWAVSEVIHSLGSNSEVLMAACYFGPLTVASLAFIHFRRKSLARA